MPERMIPSLPPPNRALSGMVLFCLISLFLTSLAGAQRGRPQRRGLPAYYQALEAIEDEGTRGRVVLRNGLRVLIDEFTIRPLAAVVSTFQVGKAQETPGEAGWSEEIGRRLWLAGELSRQMRELGGWNEFEPGLYDTSFISIVPSENVLGALGLHHQILAKNLEAADPAATKNSSQGVELLEKRLWEQAFGVALPAIPAAPDLEKLEAFRKKHFHVGNMVLGVSGNVLRTRIYERVVGLYGRLTAGTETGRPVSTVSLGETLSYLHLRGAGSSERLLMGFRVPAPGHPDSATLEMIEVLLTAGRGALLQRTQVASGFSSRASADLLQDRRGRLLQISLAPRQGKIDSAEIAVLSLLEVLAQKGPPPADLIRARSQLLRTYFEQLQQVRERAVGMSRAELAGKHNDFWERPAKLALIGNAQIKSVASRYLTQSNLILVEHFPDGGEIRNFDAATLLKTFQLLVSPERDKLAEELATTPQVEAQDLTFKDFKPSLLDPPLKRTSILRGPDIYLEEEHTVPLVSAGFYFPGGRAEETEQIEGITELMLRQLLAGVERRYGFAVWMPFESRGARFELVNEPEYFGIQVTVLADAFVPLLKSIVGWFHQPELAGEDFEQVRAEVMALNDQMQANPDSRADLSIRSQLFKDHPYGRNRLGSSTSLSRLTAEDVQNWALRQLTGFHPFIVIRGHVNGTSFLPPLIPVLSNSKMKVKQGPNMSEVEGEAFHATALSTGLRVGFRGPKRGSFDDWALDVLESLLELREGVIPADASLQQLNDPVSLQHFDFFNEGVVAVTAHHQGPATQDAVEAKLLKLLTELERAPLRDQEILRSIVLTITRFHASQQDSATLLKDLAHNLLAGEKVGYRDEYLATIKGLLAADLRSLAGRIFSVAVGPATEDSP